MNKNEKVEKDPIKEKYLKKVGFFKKIQMKFNDFKQNIKSNKSIMEDIGALKEVAISVIGFGIFGSLALTLFGFEFGIMKILSCGTFLWILENKLINMATRILGSFKLVQIYK